MSLGTPQRRTRRKLSILWAIALVASVVSGPTLANGLVFGDDAVPVEAALVSADGAVETGAEGDAVTANAPVARHFDPAIDLEKYASVNGPDGPWHNADRPETATGADVWMRIEIKNTGNADLTDFVLADDVHQELLSQCPSIPDLGQPGTTSINNGGVPQWSCVFGPIAALEAGPHLNTVQVDAAALDEQGNLNGLFVWDSDPAGYIGIGGTTSTTQPPPSSTTTTTTMPPSTDPAMLGDFVWLDDGNGNLANAGNGIQDPGELPVSALRVDLVMAGQVVDSTFTDAQGLYKFNDLTPDVSYSVRFDDRDGYIFTHANQGSNSTDSDASILGQHVTQQVSMAPGEFNDTLDAGLFMCPIRPTDGQILLDMTGTRLLDSGPLMTPFFDVDVPAGSYRVTLASADFGPNHTAQNQPFEQYFVRLYSATSGATYDSSAISDLADSDSVPNWLLELVNGDDNLLVVGEDVDQIKGWHIADLIGNQPTANSIDPICVLLDPVEPELSSLGNFVWLDDGTSTDQVEGIALDGIQQESEQGLGGVRVELLDENMEFITFTTTAADGSYLFDGLAAGTYFVQFVLPEGYIFSPLDQGGDDALDSDANDGTADPARALGKTEAITLPAGTDDPTWDAGLFLPANSIDIEKATNGFQSDTAPGEFIATGAGVTWTYVVTNTGDMALSNIVVTDSDLGVIAGPDSGDTNNNGILETTETWLYSATGTATAGQYANLGSVVGTPPSGLPDVTDEDPSHYFGSNPAIDIEKATNGSDSDFAPGENIAMGAAVTWTYVVTNTGNVALSGIAVTDDQGVAVSCPATELAPQALMTCTATGTAIDGQYANLGTVVGTPPTGADDNVTDNDPSHYFGEPPVIDLQIEKKIANPDDPENPDAVVAGTDFEYRLTVTNLGPDLATGVVVLDALPARIDAVDVDLFNPAAGFEEFPFFDETSDGVGDPFFRINNPPAVVEVVELPGVFLTFDSDERLATNGVTYNSATASRAGITCAIDSDSHAVRCEVGDLAVGESIDIDLSLTMDPSAFLRVWNRAWVYGDETLAGYEPNQTKADDGLCTETSATSPPFDPAAPSGPTLMGTGCNYVKKNATVLNEIDLAITKTASAAEVGVGGAFSYTLGVTNNGPSTAPAVRVTDTLPTNQTFVSAVTPLGTCTHDGSPTGGVLTCDLGSMLPDNPTSITVNVTMASAPAGAQCSTNVAAVADVTGVIMVGTDEITWPESDLGNNQASAEVCVPAPTDIDLELTKSVDQAVVPLGTAVVWTITVTNQGPAAATGVTVSDNLPAGVSYVSDNGGGAFNSATGIWTIGGLAVGASATLQITTTVDVSGTHINEAQVATADQTDIDSTPGNNIATEDDQDPAEVGTVLQAATTTTPPATTLPKTGLETGSLTGLGMAIIALGGLMILTARRRQQFDW